MRCCQTLQGTTNNIMRRKDKELKGGLSHTPSTPQSPIGHVITIFILTYGYVGLEMVAIELDDPFGDSSKLSIVELQGDVM